MIEVNSSFTFSTFAQNYCEEYQYKVMVKINTNQFIVPTY